MLYLPPEICADMKKVLLFVAAVCVYASALVASPAAINFDNLPDDKKFEQLFLDFGNAYQSIRYPDFQHKDAKKEQLQAAKKLYSYLKNKKSANYDEKLLQLLAARCLYNYDQIKPKEVTALFSAIDKAYPECAEHHWIYGNFLVTAGNKIPDGYAELQTYMEMKNYLINDFFVEDYAYAQFICAMPFNAYYSLTNGGTIPEEKIRSKSLLDMIRNNIKESSAKEKYETEQVWKISAPEQDYHYVYSTMLGVSFPCKESWTMQLQPFGENSPAICLLRPNDFSINGNPVGISVLLMAYPESLYSDQYKNQLLSHMNIIKTESVEISGQAFTKYTFEDLSLYTDIREGLRGYAYSATINPGKWAGVRCEHPVDVWSASKKNNENAAEGTRYFVVNPSQNRLQEPIRLFIIVDSCNAIIKETDQLLQELFSKAIFD